MSILTILLECWYYHYLGSVNNQEVILFMPYKCSTPEKYVGKLWGTGQCVDLVKIACHAPATSSWSQGVQVKGNMNLSKGTAIATFQNGKYQNRTNGDSHAAIYLGHNSGSIHVIDQWKPRHHAASPRDIGFGGHKTPNNDGNAYYVIE